MPTYTKDAILAAIARKKGQATAAPLTNKDAILSAIARKKAIPPPAAIDTSLGTPAAKSTYPKAKMLSSPKTRTGAEVQKAVLQSVMALGSGMVADPVAGLRGLKHMGSSLVKGEGFDAEGAAKIIENTRRAMTFKPTDPIAQEWLGDMGTVMEPVAEVLSKTEKYLGDTTMKLTGSAALAALATTAPTALMELSGFKIPRSVRNVVNKVKARRLKGDIISGTGAAVPPKEALFKAAGEMFEEVDALGLEIKPEAMKVLVSGTKKEMMDAGLDIPPNARSTSNTPLSKRVLERMEETLPVKPTATRQAGFVSDLEPTAVIKEKPIKLGELNQIRINAQTAAEKILTKPKTEMALGNIAIDNIDNFLDQGGVRIFKGTAKDLKGLNVGARMKAARELWGRARRSELIEDAFENARLSKGGFEKGVQANIYKILRNKKQSRYFSQSELKALNKFADGSKALNVAQVLGNFDIIGKSPGLIGTMTLAASVASGKLAMYSVPFIGRVGKNLANRLVLKDAAFLSDTILAGRNAPKIAEAYIRHTPKHLRTPAELSELLIRGDIDLAKLDKTDLMVQAAELTRQQRLAIAASVGAAKPEGETNE